MCESLRDAANGAAGNTQGAYLLKEVNMYKRVTAIALAVVMMVTMALSVTAENSVSTDFTDVSDSHWAKEAIDAMAERGIINGYNDGTFKPSETVSRAEFAKMMVKTLDLDTYKPSSPTFLDVEKGHWAYTYVETAKKYLTGFRSSEGDRFKPDQVAVREDMAVAVVNGLYDQGAIDSPDKTDLSVLDNYDDEDGISDNLRKYVAAAINEGIMTGDGEGFNPKGSLTRAEAATLLYRLIAEEKVVYVEEKVTYDTAEDIPDTTTPVTTGSMTPTLSSAVNGDDLVLEWTQVPSEGFKYYKVVLSMSDSSPSYPDNGYAQAISNAAETRIELNSGHWYNGGDLGGSIKGGNTYYAAITAVYDSGKYTSNVKQVTVPGTYTAPDTGSRTPDLSYSVNGDSVYLDWTQVSSDNFKYYKVVLSEYDSSPSYPDNGYAKAISNVSETGREIYNGHGYNGGDVGGSLKGGKTYYVAITAVYNDGKYTSNVKTVTIPGSYVAPSIGDRTPELTYDVETYGVKLDWTQVPSDNFKYYKIVLSQSVSDPYYPDYGYLTYISNAAETSYVVYDGAHYNDGNKGGIGGKVKDETYYMTITAVYNDGKYTSNHVKVTVPDK